MGGSLYGERRGGGGGGRSSKKLETEREKER